MLSIAQSRKISPELRDLSDDELEAALKALYELGQLAFDTWSAERQTVSRNPLGVQTEVVRSGRLEQKI